MNKALARVPIPISGLMLALAALGNLLLPYGAAYRNLLGLMAGCVFLLITAKVITHPKCVQDAFKNPVVASVTPTFSMGLMILSTYIRPYAYSLAYGIWLLSLVLHIILIVWFSAGYIRGFHINNVFPSYFIVFVGIVTGSVTAPMYQMMSLGQILFWFGFLANLILLPVVIYRLLVIKKMPEETLPTVVILAAPTSLCLAGYLNTFPEKNLALLAFMTSLALLLIVIALSQMPKLFSLQYYPSYSAFTFPFVISAIAIKGASAFLFSSGWNIPLLRYTGSFLEVWSVLIVGYVTLRYTAILLPLREMAPKPAKKRIKV
jgi:exfoliative toxin A/B